MALIQYFRSLIVMILLIKMVVGVKFRNATRPLTEALLKTSQDIGKLNEKAKIRVRLTPDVPRLIVLESSLTIKNLKKF